MGVFAIVVLNTTFGALYVLTKIRQYNSNLWLNLSEFILCALNGIFMLMMACMMLSAVNTIKRITYENSKDPNNRIVTLHLIMIFSAFLGMTTLWTLFGVAWFKEYEETGETKEAGRETRTVGILAGNIGNFIAELVLLYIFWGFGIGLD